ncbi:MAG: hypothetical protein AAF533_14940 [Acidobacteriota bacterium]
MLRSVTTRSHPTDGAHPTESPAAKWGRTGAVALLVLLLSTKAGAVDDCFSIILRSGNGSVGDPDAQISMLEGRAASPLRSDPFTPDDFADACAGPMATIVNPHPAWIPGLSVDPEAQWIAVDASRDDASALYCQQFVIPDDLSACCASLDLTFAVDDISGDPGGPNPIGAFLNGEPLDVFGGWDDGGFREETRLIDCDISGLLQSGVNTFQFYQRDRSRGVSGALYSAEIRVRAACDCRSEDSDDDGVPDCIDQCPEDPVKTDPGDCGCGVPDDDSDGDLVSDCLDCCPEDPVKTEPGDCGCGRSDVDSDGDGVLDCDDACAGDPTKTDPGGCGCGVPDVDSDGDGVLDCDDGCPFDDAKTEAGTCGCGITDDDSDGDGLPDCLEPLVCGDCELRLLIEAALPSLPHDASCGEGLPAEPLPCCALVAQVVDALTGDVLPSTHACAAPCDEPCESHDFDGFEAGTVITTEVPGLTISGSSPVMVFDTSEPTCGDDDLATPGSGPGNVVPLGGVLILSELGSSCAPDDARDGGVMVFELDESSELHSIGLLDLDHDEEAVIRTFDAAGELIKEITVLPQAVDNGWQEVLIERCGVRVIEVELTGSAAVTHLACRDGDRRRRVTGRADESGSRSRSHLRDHDRRRP